MKSNGQERVWFYYSNEQQVGPMGEAELKKAIEQGAVHEDDYIYREGFSDWKALKEVPEFKSGAAARQTVASPAKNANADPSSLQGSDYGSLAYDPKTVKRKGERQPIHELVVAHNGSHVATGHISNISVSGVYFETVDSVFSLNDEIKITLKEGRGLGKPMHLSGIVVRQCKGPGRDGPGYGLELRGVDEAARGRILEYIKRHQAS
jgi:GYF domain 2/PilZ domain